MSWKELVERRLRGVTSHRKALVELWDLWGDCGHETRNSFEIQRVEVGREAARTIEETPDHVRFLDTVRSMEGDDFVREAAVFTAQLDRAVGDGIDILLAPVQYFEIGDDEGVWMFKRATPFPDASPRVTQGLPRKALFKHMKFVRSRVFEHIKVRVDDPYPPPDITSDARYRSTLGLHDGFEPEARGYETSARYRPTMMTRPDGASTLALSVIDSGATDRIEYALSLAESRRGRPCLDVFPELSVDRKISETFRAKLAERRRPDPAASLSLSFLMPGTFHVQGNAGEARFHNHADLYDIGRGRIVLSQRKMWFFKDNSFDPPVDEALISSGDVTILPTPLGTLAILICRDFGDETLNQFLIDLDLDYALVPSMGKGSTVSMIVKAAEFACRETGGTVIWSMQTPPVLPAGDWEFSSTENLRRFVFHLDDEGHVERNPKAEL